MGRRTRAYENPLRSLDDLSGWIAEGPAVSTAEDDGIQLASPPDLDRHWVLWCPEVFDDGIRVTWEFSPRSEPGLAMIFVGATARDGGDIFDDDLAPRDGIYPQYHSGDLRTLHVSYFRRRWDVERAFHTCNLRKSPGFHLVAQGADPLPAAADASDGFYRMELIKDGPLLALSIEDLPIFRWEDDGRTGSLVGGGRIGFRQMAPLVARYRSLRVEAL